MDTQGPSDPSGKPPAAVIAAAFSAEPAEEVKTVGPMADVAEVAGPAVVDPNYLEPTPLAVYRADADTLDVSWSPATEALVKALLGRIEALESVAMPFCVQGMMMSNSRMCLIAANRGREPAGGTWISGSNSIQMQPNETLFFNTIDVVGRGKVQDHMVELFNKVQAQNAAIEEKAKHLDGATLAGPIGGPVGGQVH